MQKLGRWVFHPFIMTAYPIFALLAYNIKQVGPIFVIRPLLLGLILAAVLLGLFQLVLKDWHRAAVATTFSLLLFYLYGQVYHLISTRMLFGLNIGRHRFLAPFWIILLGAGLWMIVKKIKTPRSWTGPTNLISLLLLAFTLVQIASYEIHSAALRQQRQSIGSTSIASELTPPPGSPMPDIYYIILDTYPRSDALQQAFGYDNSAFLKSLEDKGFYVATCSQSNYNSTEPSLTSSLNMNYLAALNSQFTPPNPNLSDVVPYLQNNAVVETLKDLGYHFVAFESGFPPTEFQAADVYLSPQSDIHNLQFFGGLTPFEAMLFQTTALDFIYDLHFLPRQLENTLFSSAYLLHRDRMLFEFSQITEVPSLPAPKCVFMHVLAPHNPFVFGPNGEVLERNAPFTLNGDLDALSFPDYSKGFVGQVNYLDTRTLEVVDKILAGSKTPPIVIIQGDHGSPRTPEWNMTNLNVYYLPGGGAQNLYPSISPVNSFRVIFNTYFGGRLKVLPDQACDTNRSDPYNCTMKVDPNPTCAAMKKP